MRKERSEKVRKAKKNLSKIHHPINLKTGKLQTAEEMKNQFDEEFTIIESCANEACLSQSCMDRLAKAKRHFAGIVVFLYSFFSWYTLFVDGYKLESEMRLFFDEVIFPLSYLKMTWKKLSKKDREEIQPLKAALEARLQQATYSQETKKDLMAKGKECAEGYQRSSSCVEGRNGVLSFYHHRFHRLNDRCLKCLTILHNFHRTRSDNTTAAERFFGCQHENLFDSLVANVRIPGRPQKQHHDAERRQAGWEKRRAATTPVAA